MAGSAFSRATDGPVKMGILALVVGPSGAGKDALLTGARERLAAAPDFAFPERIVTRAATSAERHGTMTADAFLDARKKGAFALSWHAHGLWYALPAAIDAILAEGRIVVVNVSRHSIDDARLRYPRVVTVLVDAPGAMRAERLTRRGREARAEIDSRLARNGSGFSRAQSDHVIDNTASLDEGIDALCSVLQQMWSLR